MRPNVQSLVAVTLRVTAFILLGVCPPSIAEEADIIDTFGSETMISQATGYSMPLDKAPAIASIVTDADIRNIGARTLAQALDPVPGLQVVTGRGTNRLLSIRGIFADLGPDVLIKRNNVPISQGFFTTLNPFDLLPVNNIERIEIIRGPNSATDGADALAGVVNIITKPSSGYRGTEFGGRAGIHDTFDGWLTHGSRHGPIDFGLGLSFWNTKGTDEILETDFQSQLDRLTGNSTSLAPGPAHTDNYGTDLEMNLSGGPLRLRVGYYAVLHTGTGVGSVQVLDPNGEAKNRYFSTDLTYDDHLSDDIEITGLFSYINRNSLLGETFLQPGGLPQLPDGVVGDIKTRTRLFRGEGSVLWSGWAAHKWRLSGGAYVTDVYDVEQHANALSRELSDGNFVTLPLGGIRDLTAEELAFPENSQRTVFGALLDEWNFVPDWTLTTGLRFDDFEDIDGISVTPRVSLVWDFAPRTTMKWLYGRGFRPPTFIERLTRPTQGVFVGDPDLDPQTIDTLEYQIIHWGSRHRVGINLFGYWLQDPIVGIGTRSRVTFANGDQETGYGFELEGSYLLTDHLRLIANYAFRDTVEEVVNFIGSAPRHVVYAEGRWEFLEHTFFDVNLKAVLDRDRAIDDPREPVDDYATVNLTLRRTDIFNRFDIGLVVRNLFDSDNRDPSSDTGLSATTVPLADIPLAGREFWGELRARF